LDDLVVRRYGAGMAAFPVFSLAFISENRIRLEHKLHTCTQPKPQRSYCLIRQ
jgi:hypothetical protein